MMLAKPGELEVVDEMSCLATLQAFAARQSTQPLRGTPFYKPTGHYFGMDLQDDGLLENIAGSKSKSLHFGRLLLASYENEFVYVPDDPSTIDLETWKENYSDEKLHQSHRVRHLCERPYFKSFRDDVQVTGRWTVASFKDYFEDYRANLTCADTKAIVERIHDSASPHHAAKFHAIQLAAEFLVEASGMTRNLQGYFGPEQSEYFKIVNDEYGYGVHGTKHSTLYKEFVESIGLNSRPHYYWWFYISATFFADNYINMLSTNHRNFFNHLGSLTQNENAFAVALKYIDEMYRDLFPNSNTDYFREHIHIDEHHGRMAFQDICLSLIERLGDYLIPEIVRGFEESMYLGKLYRREFISHLNWFDAIWDGAEVSRDGLVAEDPEFFTTMVDHPTALAVERGTVFVHVMPGVTRPVLPGESLAIPAGVLFGLTAEEGSSFGFNPTANLPGRHDSHV